MRRYLTPTRIRFGGIDPGFRHLAVAVIECDTRTLRVSSDQCQLVDAVRAQEQCTQPGCVHTKTTSSRLRHVYPRLDKLLRDTHAIYIERQPLTGMTDIEQLLFDRWRHVSKLINSRKMRKRLDCWTDDYDERKVLALCTASTLRAQLLHKESELSSRCPPWQELGSDRQHDAAEAWLYAYMAYTEWRDAQMALRTSKRRRTQLVVKPWEQFRYTAANKHCT